MKLPRICTLGVAISLACTACQSANAPHANHEENEAQETAESAVKMKLDQVPPAVRDGLMREAGGASITEVDKEQDDGKTIYETDVMLNGANWEIKVAEDGSLLSKKMDNEPEDKAGKKAD